MTEAYWEYVNPVVVLEGFSTVTTTSSGNHLHCLVNSLMSVPVRKVESRSIEQGYLCKYSDELPGVWYPSSGFFLLDYFFSEIVVPKRYKCFG